MGHKEMKDNPIKKRTEPITFCIKLKFLQSFDRKGAQYPIKFFSKEPPETISFSALSESVSSTASSEAAIPNSALIPLSCSQPYEEEKGKNYSKKTCIEDRILFAKINFWWKRMTAMRKFIQMTLTFIVASVAGQPP